jgi:hypothetical protein
MEETIAPITFLNKTFIFLEKKDNKIKKLQN